ncbi:MAG: flagellar brake protein [Pseudomonadales bacterium]|nr:flagellar brake protein [Pseudomonadales bacterium]
MWFSNLRQKFTTQSNKKKITESKQIKSLLSKIQKARTHLTVNVEDRHGKAQDFASFLLKIDKQLVKPRLVFDELFPLTGNKLLKAGDDFNVHVDSNGIIIEFSARILRIEQEKNSALYYCDYPEKVTHEQQRKAYRVKIKNKLEFPVMLMSDNRSAIKGNLGDLSNTGMRVDLYQPVDPPLQKGEIIQNCYVAVAKGKSLKFSAQIKHIGTNRAEKRKFVGLHFTNLEKNGDQLISKLVLTLQSQGKK